MKMSMRAKRMARHHDRNSQSAKLNLTSLMDIFTILVFFLMVNSSDVQVLKDTKTLVMPKSVSSELPKETLLVQVDSTGVLVQGRKVATIPEIEKLEEDVIPGLDQELKYQAERRPQMTEEEQVLGRKITIQGDKEIPYSVLKKIMATCAQAEFRDISLAVTRILEKNKNKGQGG